MMIAVGSSSALTDLVFAELLSNFVLAQISFALKILDFEFDAAGFALFATPLFVVVIVGFASPGDADSC